MGKISIRYNQAKNTSSRSMIWMVFTLVFGFAVVACSHAQEPTVEPQRGLEVPDLSAVPAGEHVIYNTEGRYTLLYVPEYKLSRWVAYTLTRSDIKGDAGRSGDFKIDPQIERSLSATDADYLYSGYNKGHLLPSADRQQSKKANGATFLYSNAAPQLRELNGGAWKVLEGHLRTLLTEDYDILYIVVGGVLTEELRHIGAGKVAVPELFFKAVIMRQDYDLDSVAYVMPNNKEILEGKKFDSFKVSIDSVERLTGLDLFPRIEEFQNTIIR